MSRLLVELAIGTGTDPLAWERLLERDPRMMATVFEVMRERAERRRRGE